MFDLIERDRDATLRFYAVWAAVAFAFFGGLATGKQTFGGALPIGWSGWSEIIGPLLVAINLALKATRADASGTSNQ
jgi:hypothetical protein